jgi:Protein of unknown function (DUF2786)
VYLVKIRQRVDGLRAKAAHPNTGPEEAQTFREGADRIAKKYGLDRYSGLPALIVPKPKVVEPVRIHLLNGFAPRAGDKTIAVCHCGYSTTPRSTGNRALAALRKDHLIDTPECVLCGESYAWASWTAIRDTHLWVLKDVGVDDEFLCCRDVMACVARTKDA